MNEAAGSLNNRYVVIMAGGRGERFWPVSRQATPKQLIKLLGARSLLQQAVDRVLPVVEADHIFIITNRQQADAVRRQLPELPDENIIAEPVGRDTCAAVTLGAALVAARNPQGVMAVLSADHLIPTVELFRQPLLAAWSVAEESAALNTLGIPPTDPSTGYGYIRLGEAFPPEAGSPTAALKKSTPFFKALAFVEKPNLETAEKYLASGDYRWNAGMFLWSCETLFKNLRQHQPLMADAFLRWKAAASASTEHLMQTLEEDYPGITKISIDFALMEKAHNILVADTSFEWDDLGSWPALMRHLQHDGSGNCSNTPFICLDSDENLVFDVRQKLSRTPTALLGVQKSLVVFTDDVTLIAHQSQSQRIKELLAKISQSSDYQHLL
jgi:mannose-1-phosphate guanylyltransferase